MKLETSFRLFLQEIALTDPEEKNLKKAHEDLKKNLKEYSESSDFKELICSDFIQGSLKRKTCLKARPQKRSDIDVVIVTKLHESEFSPQAAQAKFLPFVEKYYSGKYKPKGRCIGVTLDDCDTDLDIVITSNPTEAQMGFLTEALFKNFDSFQEWESEELQKSLDKFYSVARLDGNIKLSESNPQDWKIEPLRIPDKDAKQWQDTNPMAQVYWTIRKNQNCNNLFLPVVRAVKWMRDSFGGFPDFPKGYTLEHIVGDCCPDGIVSIADGVTFTLEEIVNRYLPFIQRKEVPILKDRGVDTNVLSRQKFNDFLEFYNRISVAAQLAREALDADESHQSSVLWRQLLGEEFPLSDKPEGGKSYKAPVGIPDSEKKRFA